MKEQANITQCPTCGSYGDWSDELALRISIAKSECERLKRLEENRIKKVASLKAVMALNSKTKSYSEDEIALIDDVIILLESLDK